MFNQINPKITTNHVRTQVLVIGSGPGGYTAAFRAADLGKRVTLVEQYPNLGGVCLNVGCIPSKALLHAVHVMEEAKELEDRGISFSKPKLDLAKLRDWVVKQTINKLNVGIKSLANLRKINIVVGVGEFSDPNTVQVKDRSGNIIAIIEFEHVIIAVGSRPIELPFLPKDRRIMDSTAALELTDLPESLLIIGGGIIGVELGTVYAALGSKVTVVELGAQLLPGADVDLVEIWQQRMQKKFHEVWLNTKVEQVVASSKYLEVNCGGKGTFKYDKILCAIGRRPNSDRIGLEGIGVKIDARGFITTDQQGRTNIEHVFAIGDVSGPPMLAHKAIPEGKIAAEVICGKKSYRDHKIIPNVAYTIPEIAWIGLTEEQCKLNQVKYEKSAFPWQASGRAVATGKTDGLTKILFNPIDGHIIGAGIVGENASELINELIVAMELGATAGDLGNSMHPHPTLAETVMQAAELFEGTITDLPNPNLK